jgi:hypothetical protein
MARGRELRAQGVKGEQVDTVRFKEINSGKLAMPQTPSALYTLTGPPNSFDAATGKVTGAKWLYVGNIPGATEKSTGITEKPAAVCRGSCIRGRRRRTSCSSPGCDRRLTRCRCSLSDHVACSGVPR